MKWTNIKYCPLLCTKVRVQPICVFQLTYNLKQVHKHFSPSWSCSGLGLSLKHWDPTYVALYRPILCFFFSLSFVLSTDFFVFSKLSQHQTFVKNINYVFGGHCSVSSGSSTYTLSSVHSSAMSWYVDYWQFKTLSPVYTTEYTDLLEKKTLFPFHSYM